MVINTSRRLDTGHECYGRLLRTPSATINRSSRPPIAPIALSRTNTCHQLRPPRAVSVGSQNAPQTSSNRGIPATQSGIEDVTASLGVLGQPVSRQVTVLTALLEQLQGAGSTQAKVAILSSLPEVAAFLAEPMHGPLASHLQQARLEDRYVLMCLPAIGQVHVLQHLSAVEGQLNSSDLGQRLHRLATGLLRVEQFYNSIGGLVGYQLKSLQLIAAGTQARNTNELHAQSAAAHQSPMSSFESPAASLASFSSDSLASLSTMSVDDTLEPVTHTPCQPSGQGDGQVQTSFHVPRGLDLAGEAGSGVGMHAALQGLAAMPQLAEIYPVGGAGDRLGLVDAATGESLPAAVLPYGGRSMLEGLIRDLQAREYLYYKLHGQQLMTPVAVMTSDAKGNHRRISELLGSLHWLGRRKDSFQLFRQPLVPVVSAEDGRWLLSGLMKPMLKPGGHGVIWKLMWDNGVFDWLQERGSNAALVRQISNPMAGMDTTLLALAGTGAGGGYRFGFMSCERTVGASEGLNVLQERTRMVDDGQGGQRPVYEYGMTNVEYTEFERLGLKDHSTDSLCGTSVFPANTNLLYVQLAAAREVIRQAISSGNSEQLMPGLIFNLKKKVQYQDPLTGSSAAVTAGRMECTMQNIADFLVDSFDTPQSPQELQEQRGRLSTFLVNNMRRKVTSSAKKRLVQPDRGSSKPLRIAQTPEGSFYDLQRNAWQLLQRCGLSSVPEPGSPEQYLAQGPGLLVLYHPALGPLWDIIAQKVVGGSLAQGGELVLEVAEARLLDVRVTGSLRVHADSVMGHYINDHTAASISAGLNGHLRKGNGFANSSHHEHSHVGSGSSSNAHEHNGNGSTVSTSHSHFSHHGSLTTSFSTAGRQSPVSQERLLQYSSRCGRVKMVDVIVENAGIDWTAAGNVYWKHQVARKESCLIEIQGRGEFEAHNVTLQGDLHFTVPDGYRMVISQHPGGQLHQQLLPLDAQLPSWEWQYSADSSTGAVRLSYCSHLHSSQYSGMHVWEASSSISRQQKPSQ